MSSSIGFDHHNNDYGSQPRGFLTPPPTWKTRRCCPAMPASEKKPPLSKTDIFRVIHKVPCGDSPYVRAKHVQLINKDPSKAISLFWAAINSGDRVDSALKDMAVVMKQLDRSDEAIEAIKSFRHLCPPESQQSLDNILVELYKQSGRIEEEIEMLRLKLKQVEEGMAFGGKRTKMARSQGKKVHVRVEKEYSRLLGNLAWAYMQHKDFKSAEEHYRKALSLQSDKNKQCNLAICLMHMNKLTEAKFLLQAIRVSSGNDRMDESYAKSYERASQMMVEFESHNGHAPKVKPCDVNDDGTQLFSPLPLPLPVGVTNNKAFTELPYEKRADFDWRRNNNRLNTGQEARKRVCESPFSIRDIPRVPSTQPRRCMWSGGQTNGRLAETSCRKLTFGSFSGCENAAQLVANQNANDYYSTPYNEIPKATKFSSTAIKECDMPSDSASSCPPGSGKTKETSDNISIEEENLNTQEKSERKMTWADMVEEDERKFGKWRNNGWRKNLDDLSSGSPDQERFNDENRDSNIVPETPNNSLSQAEKLSHEIGLIDLGSGYFTQPGKTALSTNSSVRRSLCFDQHQKTETENSNSPLTMKVLNFEGHGLALPEDFGSDKSTKRRNRLQVFEDITTQD
ncbi:hypothetical protein OROHE_024737 [Orobanche hederae]